MTSTADAAAIPGTSSDRGSARLKTGSFVTSGSRDCSKACLIPGILITKELHSILRRLPKELHFPGGTRASQRALKFGRQLRLTPYRLLQIEQQPEQVSIFDGELFGSSVELKI